MLKTPPVASETTLSAPKNPLRLPLVFKTPPGIYITTPAVPWIPLKSNIIPAPRISLLWPRIPPDSPGGLFYGHFNHSNSSSHCSIPPHIWFIGSRIKMIAVRAKNAWAVDHRPSQGTNGVFYSPLGVWNITILSSKLSQTIIIVIIHFLIMF